MHFGAKCKTDIERVAKSMVENQLRDPMPNQKSILGLESKVMNLRPLEKNKHMSPNDFRYGNFKS